MKRLTVFVSAMLVSCVLICDGLSDLSNLSGVLSTVLNQTEDIAEKAKQAASAEVQSVMAKVALQSQSIAQNVISRIGGITQSLEDDVKGAGQKIQEESEAIYNKIQSVVQPLEKLVIDSPQEFKNCEGAIEKSAEMPALIAANELARVALDAADDELANAQTAASATSALSVDFADAAWSLTRDMLDACQSLCANVNSVSVSLALKPAKFDVSVNATVFGKNINVEIDPANIDDAAKKIFMAAKSELGV